MCIAVQQNLSIHLEKNVCDNTFSPRKCEILTNLGLFLAFKAVNILLGGICMPNQKIDTKRHLVKVQKVAKMVKIMPQRFFLAPVKF